MCSSTVHLADARPRSPTTLAYESITHTSFISSTHAIYREADHAPTCAYRLLSFLICPLGSQNITPSYCSFPDERSESTFVVASCRHLFAAGIAVSTSGHYFSSSSNRARSIIICPRQTTGPRYTPITSSRCTMLATRNETAAPTPVTHTSTIVSAATTMGHQVSLCRCHSLVRVRRREPRHSPITSNRHPTQVWG